MTIIKKIIYAIPLVLILQSCMVSQRPKMDFFNNPYYDFKGAKFTTVDVPMWLMKLTARISLKDEENKKELIAIIKKISDIKIMTIQNGNPEMLSDFAQYLTNNRYEDWMTVKKNNEIIHFQAKKNKDIIQKLLVTINTDNQLVYIDISSKLTPEELSQLINYSENNDLKSIFP